MKQVEKAYTRRLRRSRKRIHTLGVVYLSVHRTAQHIYAQVLAPRGERVLAAASSLDSELSKSAEHKPGTGKIKMAEAVGALVAKRAKSKGITNVAFDRAGYKYHGRVKALAEGARANGLAF